LKKGEIGGFALRRLGEIPPPPFTKGGMLFKDKLSIFGTRKRLAGFFGIEVADSMERTRFQDKRSKIVN